MPEQPQAGSILREAATTIDGRAAQRDSEKERSMARCVAAFNGLTKHNLTEEEGWMFMVVLKMARALNSRKFTLDDYVDGAAYMALAGESAGAGTHQPHEPPIKVMIAPDTELTTPAPATSSHGKDVKHFVACEGLPYANGHYPNMIPTCQLTDKIKGLLGVENPESTTTSDGYVETTFTSSKCGDSVIRHLPAPTEP